MQYGFATMHNITGQGQTQLDSLNHSKSKNSEDEKMYILGCEVTLNKGYHNNSCSRCTNFHAQKARPVGLATSKECIQSPKHAHER